MRISDWSSDVCSSDLSPPPLTPSRLPAMDARPTKAPDFPALKQRLVAALGNKGVVSDPQEVAPYLEEQRRRYKGTTPFVVRPASTEEVATAVSRKSTRLNSSH